MYVFNTANRQVTTISSTKDTNNASLNSEKKTITSNTTTVPTTPVSKNKIQFESPDNSAAVETKCLTPESPLPQPFSTPVARTSKEPTVTQISPSKSQPSSSVQPTTKRNWVNLSDRVMLSFKEKNDIQNDKKKYAATS